MKITVFVIGYKNHAFRIISTLSKNRELGKIIVYHPDINNCVLPEMADNVLLTDDFKLFRTAKCVFIASPSVTHYYYLKKIHDEFEDLTDIPYIYCEKPIVTSQLEVDWLSENIESFKNRLMCGYNLKFSNFSVKAGELINDNSFGKPVFANFQVTHGLAFKKEIGLNWRFSSEDIFSSIIGNLGVHYVNLSIHLFGDIIRSNLNLGNFANHQNEDTAIITMEHSSGVLSTIVLSYASIFSKRFELFFTDGLITGNSEGLFCKYPRDTFDSSGEFISPPEKLITEESDKRDGTLEKSLEYFLKYAVLNLDFDRENLKQAKDTTLAILRLKKI